MRQHGLQSPLDPHQVASWIVFLALTSGVYAFYVPFVEDAGSRWALVALYSVLIVAMFILNMYTSYLDPSDPGLKGSSDGEFFCGLCQASVARSSKHCRACDRCVEGFDHHCKWLNNCIGARNYWHFFALISSTCSMLVLQLAWGLWLFIRSFVASTEMRALVAEKYGRSVVYVGWQVALAVYMALLVTSVVMLGELFFFHIILISKGMSTYDYIISQRDAKLSGPPPPKPFKTCRSTKVADATTARRKVKVGINCCAAMKTHRPTHHPPQWDPSKSRGVGAGAGDSVPGTPVTGPPPPDKFGFDGTASGLHGPKEGLELSGKAAVAGTVHDLVARAVAEQGRSVGSADSALLAMQHGDGGSLRGRAQLGSPAEQRGPNSILAQRCVPECSADKGGPEKDGPDAQFSALGSSLGPGAERGGQSAQPVMGTPWPAMRAPASPAQPAGVGPRAEAGYDAAAPAGRHLGSVPAVSPGGGAQVGGARQGGLTSAPSRRVTLPPLLKPPPSPVSAPTTGGPASNRSLLFPARTPSRDQAVNPE
ncbi:hypothetical protein TSOC_000383 [Tetrabaena socialis]|uniref:S-acyltransferase n=1 Tax=Tetrabaena socialis TaxID=47790 RepID=A0A2J8AJI6_9CHLO|nr:hypothetical protein TSOC_000383 [Tetrabaena socialis]|eukprot:PNH12685.1 hypothetical protein TSOC_000383 [Tetrabaena socialis]